MKTLLGIALAGGLVLFPVHVAAQTTDQSGWGKPAPAPTAAPAKPAEPAVKKPAPAPAADVESERDRQIAGLERIVREQALALATQQQALDALLVRLAAVVAATTTAAAASPVPAPASSVPATPAPALVVKTPAPETPPAPAPAATTPPPTPAPPAAPLTIHLGDADFLIGGFMDATAVTRSTNVGSGIGTSFGGIPFSTTPQGQLSETRLSSQNSRLSLQATSKVGAATVKGYLEADFLGAGPANQFVTSNANTLRMRVYWMQVSRGTIEFLGGQSWSLLTPNRKGVSPAPSDVFTSLVMDTNYLAGLTWARQAQFRFIAHPTKTLAAAVSVENPQQFVSSAIVLPSAFVAGQVDSTGNTATPNRYPDVIGKVAFDPVTGATHQHVEVAGIVRGFRTTDTTANTSFSATGAGVSVHANVEPIKNVHLIGSGFLSHGGGRYVFGLGPDFIVNADSSLSLVRTRSGIAGAEVGVRRSVLYGYYSVASFDRVLAVDANGKAIGYGVPGSASANRLIQEATAGLTQTLFKEPRYGALQLMVQVSRLTRTPWDVPAGTPARARCTMVWVNVRYVLP